MHLNDAAASSDRDVSIDSATHVTIGIIADPGLASKAAGGPVEKSPGYLSERIDSSVESAVKREEGWHVAVYPTDLPRIGEKSGRYFRCARLCYLT